MAAAAAATVYVLLTAWASNGLTRTLADTMRAALDGYSGGDIVVASDRRRRYP